MLCIERYQEQSKIHFKHRIEQSNKTSANLSNSLLHGRTKLLFVFLRCQYENDKCHHGRNK